MDTRNYERMRRSVADAPGTSFWLKFSVEALHNRDPLDAVNDAQDLLDICQARVDVLMPTRAAAVDGPLDPGEAYPGIAHDLETVRQQRDELAAALQDVVREISWFVARRKDLSEKSDSGRYWSEILNDDLDIGRAALAKLQP